MLSAVGADSTRVVHVSARAPAHVYPTCTRGLGVELQLYSYKSNLKLIPGGRYATWPPLKCRRPRPRFLKGYKRGGVNFGTGGVIGERTKILKNVRNRRLGRAKQQISLVPMQISRKKSLNLKTNIAIGLTREFHF